MKHYEFKVRNRFCLKNHDFTQLEHIHGQSVSTPFMSAQKYSFQKKRHVTFNKYNELDKGFTNMMSIMIVANYSNTSSKP